MTRMLMARGPLAAALALATGRVASCVECHAQAADSDYLMTARARSESTLESPDSMR